MRFRPRVAVAAFSLLSGKDYFSGTIHKNTCHRAGNRYLRSAAGILDTVITILRFFLFFLCRLPALFVVALLFWWN